MDPTQSQTSVQEQMQNPIPQVPPDNPLPETDAKKQLLPLMILAVVLILALLMVGIVTLRKTGSKIEVVQTTPTPTQSPSPLPSTPATQAQLSPTTIPSVAPSSTGGGVSAGIQTPYTITLIPGWTPSHTSNSSMQIDTLVISKGGSSLTIAQAPGATGNCSYRGDTPVPGSQAFTSYLDITGVTPPLRRGEITDGKYQVCQSTANGFIYPTTYGNITYVLDDPVDQTALTEMDQMVATLHSR